MVVFPNCKLNLGLHILRKRNDGYHDIETVFYPLSLRDALEIIENNKYETGEPEAELSLSGETIPGEPQNNLCIRAYKLLKSDFPTLPPVQIYLHKQIPVAAGLGGGSANGAFTLKLLNQKFRLGLSTEKLLDYALRLGSDCPFFITNEPSFATGRGEFLETIKLDLSAFKFIVVNPGIYISTSQIFSSIKPTFTSKSIREIINLPIDRWKENLQNEFELPVFNSYPEVGSIKDQLTRSGAIYASLSGSGSTVFGVFEKTQNPPLSFPAKYFIRELSSQLKEGF